MNDSTVLTVDTNGLGESLVYYEPTIERKLRVKSTSLTTYISITVACFVITAVGMWFFQTNSSPLGSIAMFVAMVSFVFGVVRIVNFKTTFLPTRFRLRTDDSQYEITFPPKTHPRLKGPCHELKITLSYPTGSKSTGSAFVGIGDTEPLELPMLREGELEELKSHIETRVPRAQMTIR